jgi:hypothetical protein
VNNPELALTSKSSSCGGATKSPDGRAPSEEPEGVRVRRARSMPPHPKAPERTATPESPRPHPNSPPRDRQHGRVGAAHGEAPPRVKRSNHFRRRRGRAPRTITAKAFTLPSARAPRLDPRSKLAPSAASAPQTPGTSCAPKPARSPSTAKRLASPGSPPRSEARRRAPGINCGDQHPARSVASPGVTKRSRRPATRRHPA